MQNRKETMDRKRRMHCRWACLLCAWLALASCAGWAPQGEVERVDSLNGAAYAWRYRDLDSSRVAARRAFEAVRFYRSGKAEACNNLAFCAFMEMDFEQAEKLYRSVCELTKNELELLVADVGLMSVYQRTALNKEFYDYRNSALRRMNRIAEDDALFSEGHERRRLSYARSEFYIVSAVYYYYLQQRPEALENIRRVSDEAMADTAQWLHAHYVRGAASLVEGQGDEAQKLRDFDELFTTWRVALRKDFPYFEGSCLQGLAGLMASAEDYDYFREHRRHALDLLGVSADTLLPLRLGQEALQKFAQYKDVYQTVGTYVEISRYLNEHGRYGEALDTLRVALDAVNAHHRHYYQCEDTLDLLKMYDHRNAPAVEAQWMAGQLKTPPEWISRIRDQLSVSYAGLGMKERSDYNRNIYLDILEDTRQDKELESRYEALERGMHLLNRWSLAVVVGIVAVLVFFWLFNRRSKKRNVAHLRRLRLVLDICQKTTASIPAEAQTQEEVAEAITAAVADDVERLFGTRDFLVEDGQIVFPHLHLKRDEEALRRLITPYIQWALENGRATITLGDERRRLEKERYVSEQHIAARKRSNVEKKACLALVNGMQPYIDRLANEAGKLARQDLALQPEVRAGRYQYMDELVTAINDYNDILALWIRMKQGALSLHVENFALDDLFALLGKGRRVFDLRRQTFEVVPTDAWVKADRALTLFMLNTLVDNARKYTPQGGHVKVYATRGADYVEVSVEDNGRGLSPSDAASLMEAKVCDSKAIGLNDAADKEELLKSKGSGFGLMNCRGIIEKYRKTNALFSVCTFGVESRLGKGSRFYFRLPVGVRKALMGLAALCLMVLASCAGRPMADGAGGGADSLSAVAGQDTLRAGQMDEADELLLWASDYANAVYYSNIDRNYRQALVYADSALWCLNEHYVRRSGQTTPLMSLEGEGVASELQWWGAWFDTDYHVILDIRNEAAVAFLALKQWKAYRYNNEAYTALYKLLGEDQSLEEYCRQLERSAGNRRVGIWLAVLLFFLLCLGYYYLYIRRRLVDRWNLEQVLDINGRMFRAARHVPQETSSEWVDSGEDTLGQIPQRMVDEAFQSVNELVGIDRLGIAVCEEDTGRLDYVCSPRLMAGEESSAMEAIKQCFAQRKALFSDHAQILPLLVEAGGGSRCVGVLHLERRQGTETEDDRLLLELVARYTAIVLFNAVVKLAGKYRDIELAGDEARRASYEDNQLHVQNQVLDNCLSTIKHETLYYPNKIRQLVGRLRSGALTADEERETLAAVRELTDYYRAVFFLLSSCASRQLEEVTFRRMTLSVSSLLATAERYFRKASKGKHPSVSLSVEAEEAQVVGDACQLNFLFESLLDEALSVPLEGTLRLSACVDGPFVRFSLADTRRDKSQDELNHLFSPSLERMSGGAGGRLQGTEYLIAKQIVRDHDEYAGRRGCRIYAERLQEGKGFVVHFTLPRKMNANERK